LVLDFRHKPKSLVDDQNGTYGFVDSDHFAGHPAPVSHTNFAITQESWQFTDYLKALAVSFIPIFFTYGGYQQTINFGTDIENPVRNTPKGIFIGCSLVMFLYLAINFAYYKVLGIEGIAQSKSLTADLARFSLEK
jgi:APA family basic amino acid/polyamine antiporter